MLCNFNLCQLSKIDDWSVNKNDTDCENAEDKQNSRTTCTNFFTHIFLEKNQDNILDVLKND